MITETKFMNYDLENAAVHAHLAPSRAAPRSPDSYQLKKKCLAEMWSSSEEGSHLRLIDCSITQR